MKRTSTTRWVLAMAVAPVLAMVIPVSAQIATQDGRANDANLRVGSGGFNSRLPNQGVTQNQIIYGNVTGGGQFRGPLLERDQGAFTGPVPGWSTDRFVSSAGAPPTPYQPSLDLSSPVPFYGSSRGVAPPPGTERYGFSGSFIGGGSQQQLDTNLAQYRMSNDWQALPLGISTTMGTRTTLLGTRPEELALEVPEGSANQQLQLKGSPLYGIQSLPTLVPNPLDQNPLDQYGLPSLLMPGVSSDRFRFDQAELTRMRGELQNSNQNSGQEQQTGQDQGSQLSQPFNGNEQSQSSSTGFEGSRFSTNRQNPQNQNQRLVAPEAQSTQFAEMSRRLAGAHGDQFAQLQAVHEANVARRAAAARAAAAASQPSQGTVNPPQGMMRGGATAGMLNLPAMKVKSLATGVRAKGLHDLLSSAEDLMRQGKFQSAIERYNKAQEVAPNNPLISLGLANAELGAGAYRKAGGDLHMLFLSEPAVLMAQYDLASWFPPDRLKAIEQELTELSRNDTKDEMPEFLQAYLSYNQGDSQAAARHLAEARKRSGGKDPALELMQTDWKLSGGEKLNAAPEDLNK